MKYTVHVNSLTWSSSLLFYFRTIEVRALEQRILVQNIKTSESPKDQFKFIAHDEMILVASHNLVSNTVRKI